MAKEITDLRSQIKQFKYDHNLIQNIDCSKNENKEFIKLLKSNQPLPEGIYRSKTEVGQELDTFHRIYETELTSDELNEYLLFKRLDYLKKIKNYILFFVVLTVISLIVGGIMALSQF